MGKCYSAVECILQRGSSVGLRRATIIGTLILVGTQTGCGVTANIRDSGSRDSGFESRHPDFLLGAVWLIANGRLAQLVRALHSHCRGRRFESSIVHNDTKSALRQISCFVEATAMFRHQTKPRGGVASTYVESERSERLYLVTRDTQKC